MGYSRRAFRQSRGNRDANHLAILKGLRGLGREVIDLAGSGDGVLDMLVLNPVLFVEAKTPKGKLRPKQLAFIAKLERHGIPWALARTLDEALSAVRLAQVVHVEANARAVNQQAAATVAAMGHE